MYASITTLLIPACVALAAWTKSPWTGGWSMEAYMRAHTPGALAVVCVCESELSVPLSHTIHHKLLILLDHCRAFRTPRCSLKTQSEANAPNPSNRHTHTHTHGFSLSVSYSHTLTETLRGQQWSWGTLAVWLYKCCLDLIDRSCMDQVTGVESGCSGKKRGLTITVWNIITICTTKYRALFI